jgi:hypothetical protein
MSDVTLHINEDTEHEEREKLRDTLLNMEGVMAAAYHDEKPHLIIIEYDPDVVEALRFVEAAESRGLHGQLVGL